MYRRAQIAAVVAASCMLTAGAGRTSQSYTESGAMTDPLQEAGGMDGGAVCRRLSYSLYGR